MSVHREAEYSRLVMLGNSVGMRGGIAAVVRTYRAQGLFERWPIDDIPTHCDGGAGRKLLTTARALTAFLLVLFRERRILIHAHSASYASFWRNAICMLIGMLAKCAVILHLHDSGFARCCETGSGAVGRRVIRFFLERATCVIVRSERSRARIEKISAASRVICVPGPIAQRTLSYRSNLVLFVGRLERQEGIFDLLDGISALRAHVPDATLVCVGEGQIQEVGEYAERLGIADAVQLTGRIGPLEWRALLDRAAVLVLPSYVEGPPMNLLEAVAAGVPVVATAVGGVPDVIKDGVTGFLITPGDVALLQRRLRKLLLDRRFGSRMAVAARESVPVPWVPQRLMTCLDEVYASLGLMANDDSRAGIFDERFSGAA